MVEAGLQDLETPLSVVPQTGSPRSRGKYSFLLESVVGGERFGRYSFIGLPASNASGPAVLALRHAPRSSPTVWWWKPPPEPAGLHQRLPKRLPWHCGLACRAFVRLAGYCHDAVRYIEKLENSLPTRHPWLP
jgi:anthranilate synthase component 1